MIGIMARTGTNFLADVLQLIDPRLQLHRVLEEDFLFEHSNLLKECAERAYQGWKKAPGLENPDKWKELLLHQFGDACLKLLCNGLGPDKRLLAKTPGSLNVDKFFDLLPEAKLLLLIRDGRDVVESAHSTWSYEPYAFWIRQWAAGSRSMLELMSGPARKLRGSSWELVKYEDLLKKPEEMVGPLAKFLGVEGGHVDLRQLKELPIRGSSQNRDSKGNVDWNPAKKIEGFKPVGRWSNWSWRQKREFKQLAGRELAALGYAANNQW